MTAESFMGDCMKAQQLSRGSSIHSQLTAVRASFLHDMAGKPSACNLGLPWGIVARCFGLLGGPGLVNISARTLGGTTSQRRPSEFRRSEGRQPWNGFEKTTWTWPPKVRKIMAIRAVTGGLRPFCFVLAGSRQVRHTVLIYNEMAEAS